MYDHTTQSTKVRNSPHPPAAAAIGLRDLLAGARDIYEAQKGPLLCLALGGLFLPQLILSVVFDTWSASTVRELKAVEQSIQETDVGYEQLISPALNYLGAFGITAVFTTVLMLAAYLAIIDLAVRHFRDGAPESLRGATLRVIKRTSGAIFILGMLSVAVVILSRMLLFPAVIVCALSLMFPVILMVKRQGQIRSLREAFSLRYVAPDRQSRWNVMFSLFSLAALLIGVVLALAFGLQKIIDLDIMTGWSRTLAAWTIPGTDVGLGYILAGLIECATMTLLLSLYPLLTTCLYFRVSQPRALAQA